MRNPEDFSKEMHLKVLNLFLSSNAWSHRKIQAEILGLEANARGGGFVTMSILHNYGIKKEHKGVFTKVTNGEGLKILLNSLNTNETGVEIALKLYEGKMTASDLPIIEPSKRFAVAPTDRSWFNFHRDRSLKDNLELVNFWTPTPWGIRGLQKGDLFLFKVKTTNSIGGFGYFETYKEMSVDEAWNDYGEGNGFRDIESFSETLQKIVKKQNTKLGEKIGCIELSSPTFYSEEEFWLPESRGIDFAKEIVKLKYFDQPLNLPAIHSEDEATPFQPIIEKEKKKGNVSKTIREGQSEFSRKVKKAYGYKCAISGESCSEVLEAAHIQPYLNSNSNHVQNGICLRADIHKLFDAHLISIDSEYKIKVSKKLLKSSYFNYNGCLLALPIKKSAHPSRDVLIRRSLSFRD